MTDHFFNLCGKVGEVYVTSLMILLCTKIRTPTVEPRENRTKFDALAFIERNKSLDHGDNFQPNVVDSGSVDHNEGLEVCARVLHEPVKADVCNMVNTKDSWVAQALFLALGKGC